MKLVESQINKAEDSNFDIAFNVFQSGRTFKKSNPGQPDYRVCICRFVKTMLHFFIKPYFPSVMLIQRPG